MVYSRRLFFFAFFCLALNICKDIVLVEYIYIGILFHMLLDFGLYFIQTSESVCYEYIFHS